MADIFVSYKKSDEAKVEPIVRFFERHGMSVFWDTRIDSGERWDSVLEREISAAKCIVVVWTADSVSSRWVRTEADEGLERGNLVPLLLGVQKPPTRGRRHSYAAGGQGRDSDGSNRLRDRCRPG